MLTFMLHIEVHESCVDEALDTLTDIERDARADQGVLTFTWLRHEGEPTRFTLVEQWETRGHLEAHLRRDPSRWERFTHCLVGEPRSETYDAVVELAAQRVGGEVYG